MTRVALPIETKSRELDGKLWLALHLLEKGHEVIIGHDPKINQWLDKIRPDVLIAVSAGGTPRKLKRFEKLNQENVDILVLDVEGGIFRTDEDYLVRLSPEILRHVDTYLAWGKRPGEIVCENTPFSPEDVVVTGAPKFDLLHENYRQYYREEANRLRKRFGDFILITTNFGLVNHYDTEMNEDLISGENILRLKKPTDELQFTSLQQELLEAFLDAIPKLATTYSDHTVVVRPHPSENHDTYRNEFATIDRVVVDNSGSAHPWLLAADTIVHNNSTIGVESVLLDRPVFAFCPADEPGYELILPNVVSEKVTSYSKLESAISTAISSGESLGRNLDNEEMKLLTAYFRNVDGRGAERVTNVIDTIDTSKSWSAGVFTPPFRQRVIRSLSQVGVHRFYRKWEELKGRLLDEPQRTGYTAQKFPGITVNEINDRIRRMRALKDQFGEMGIGVDSSNRLYNCFWLLPRDE